MRVLASLCAHAFCAHMHIILVACQQRSTLRWNYDIIHMCTYVHVWHPACICAQTSYHAGGEFAMALVAFTRRPCYFPIPPFPILACWRSFTDPVASPSLGSIRAHAHTAHTHFRCSRPPPAAPLPSTNANACRRRWMSSCCFAKYGDCALT